MNRYRISADDEPYALEFKRNLGQGNWYHTPGLQRVLNVMRSGPGAGKYVLVVREPFQRWVLARMPGKRGAPIEILEKYEFNDLKEAEWTIFKLRWQAQTGRDIEL